MGGGEDSGQYDAIIKMDYMYIHDCALIIMHLPQTVTAACDY